MLKKIIMLFIALILLLPGAGCAQKGEPPQGDGKATQGEKREPYTYLATYYLKDNGQEFFLVREIHRVPYTREVAAAAVKELISSPPSTPGASRVLNPETRVLGINIKDGVATVDFSSEVLKANVGSQGEALGIQSIVNTLTEFPEIQAVSFRVNGKLDERAMDWWGHVGLSEQPFKRNIEHVKEPAIWVTHPVSGQVVGVPLLVKGSANVPGGIIQARLKDPQGGEIASEEARATRGAPDRGDFELRLNYDPPAADKGTLEIFWVNPGNGEAMDTVKIPVSLAK